MYVYQFVPNANMNVFIVCLCAGACGGDIHIRGRQPSTLSIEEQSCCEVAAESRASTFILMHEVDVSCLLRSERNNMGHRPSFFKHCKISKYPETSLIFLQHHFLHVDEPAPLLLTEVPHAVKIGRRSGDMTHLRSRLPAPQINCRLV